MKRVTPHNDSVARSLMEDYNTKARDVEHCNAMEDLAETEHGKAHWRHLGWLANRLKDEILGMLYSYQKAGSLRDMIASGKEAQEARDELLDWLEDNPDKCTADDIRRAKDDRLFLADVAYQALDAARRLITGKEKRLEAAELIKAHAYIQPARVRAH